MDTTQPQEVAGRPRITPLAESAWSDEVRELLTAAGGGEPSTSEFFTVIVRHPGLVRRWMPFGGKLLAKGTLPERDREVLVLRTAWRCGAAHEWGLHVRGGHRAGLSAEQVDAIANGPDDPRLDDDDRLLVAVVDELHDDATVSDRTWARLAERYDERQLIELPMLVGQYHLIAFLQNSLGISPDPDAGGMEAR